MATTLNEIISIGTPTRVYKYELTFDRVPGGLSISTPGRDIHLRCTSATKPKKTNQVIEISLPGGHVLPEHGIYKPEGIITLTLVETENCTIEELIDSLQQCVWEDNTGKQLHMNSTSGTDMSIDFTLTQMSVEDEPIRVYKMLRAFYEDVDRPQFDASTSDATRIPLMFRYTDFRNERA